MAEQGDFVTRVLDREKSRWKIAFGHHPYISNGIHGNAAGNIERFFADYVCGKIDLYLSGHDHNLQVLPGPSACPGTFVVSGGGGKNTYRLPGKNPARFQARTFGFAYVRVTPAQLSVEMIDAEGRALHSAQITRAAGE